MKPIRFVLVLLPVLALLGAGCKSRVPTRGGGAADSSLRANAFLQEALAKDLQFQFIVLRGNANYQAGNNSQRFAYRINIERGVQIWASFSMLGIEGARVHITRDSVYLMDKLHRQYFVTDYAYIRRRTGLPVDYEMLQDVLLGRSQLAAGCVEGNSATAAVPNPDQYKCYRRNLEGVLVNLLFDAASQKLTYMTAQDSNTNTNVLVSYANYQPIGTQQFAYLAKVKVRGAMESDFQMEHNRVEIDPSEAPIFRFSIPANYERISPP